LIVTLLPIVRSPWIVVAVEPEKFAEDQVLDVLSNDTQILRKNRGRPKRGLDP